MWLLRLRRNLYAEALARELVIDLVTRHGYDALKIIDERVCAPGGSRLDRAVNLKAYEILCDMQKVGVPMDCATSDSSPAAETSSGHDSRIAARLAASAHDREAERSL